MFIRSVVGKLWITILLLVSFVLAILTILLLQFFEDYHVDQAERDLKQTAVKVNSVINQHDDDAALIFEMVETLKDPSSRVVIIDEEDKFWVSASDDEKLPKLDEEWIRAQSDLVQVIDRKIEVREQKEISTSDQNLMIVGIPLEYSDGAVYVYQSLSAIKETNRQTTQFIWLAAGIAIVLTTFFAFFLSTRINAPLIKMREGAIELARGEFNTKVPILTHDEIGELAMAFNRMGRQLKYHINALSQEKEQLYSILSSMADGVITLNRKAEIIVSNPPANKFLEDWFYEHNQEMNDEKYLPDEIESVLKEVIDTEKEISTEMFIQGRTFAMIMTPLYDQAYVRGAVAVIRDMTEERRLDQLREDFIANVSHELRTPISLLQGYSEAIVDGVAQTAEEKNELATIIYDESLRMGRLVNELLDLAGMKAGHIQLNKEKVDVKLFLDRIMRKFSGIANDKEIELTLSAVDSDEVIEVDPDRIEQVFTNLIDNALNHTEENGRVVVKMEDYENELLFSIKDNGSGIPQEDLPFVFERFYKADKSRKRTAEKKGTGLGLAIAKNIVEAHKGSISVQSMENEGNNFFIQTAKKYRKVVNNEE